MKTWIDVIDHLITVTFIATLVYIIYLSKKIK